ncbi:MAG: aldolase catalytic domain-containing protein [Bacteroidales bacterium]|nr:aldolase catalytic domain-containing protein [Bacteroidales bacterium]
MYRKEIKVLDCTIRDGGLMNKWQFSDEFVKGVYKACVDAGVDYFEIGYKSSEKAFSRTENGDWKFCDEASIRRIVGDNNTNTKIACLVDIGRIEFEDILPKSESLIDMMRVACYDYQIDKAIELAEHCMNKGYEATINLMAVSTVKEHALDEVLKDVAKCKVPIFYLVDSFGSMYCEDIQHLMKKYTEALPGKTIGFHGHNNMQLAFSNTIETIIQGANMLDGTILGIGRGAGNCTTELLLAFLKNPKYKIKPILEAIHNHLLPLSKKIDWGYHMPYMLSGATNEHPRTALKWMDEGKKDDVIGFFEELRKSKEELE